MELAFAATVLGTGGLAFLAATLGSLQLTHQTRNINRATDQAMTVIEAFRYRAAESFDDAMFEFAADGDPDVDGRPLYRRLPGMHVETEVVMDETRFEPAVDLNGDGDRDDQDLAPSEVLASYLDTTVSWDGGAHSLSYVTLVSRMELKALPPAGDGGDGGNGPPDDRVNLVLAWIGIDEDLGSLSLGVHADGDAPVIGLQIDASRSMAISEIVASGHSVFSQRIDPPATGTVIPTMPFTLDAGLSAIDSILFVDRRGRPGRMHGVDFTVTFFLESGQTQVVTIEN